MSEHHTDIAIIGAGASGMMAAYFCAQNSKKVIVLDHNKQIGRKILISGGGRCNFTNMYGEASDYHSQNQHFVKSALSRYSPWDFVSVVDKYNVKYYEKKLGQLFCRESAKEINRALLAQVQNNKNIEIMLGQKGIEVQDDDNSFILKNNDLVIKTKKLIIATGGLVLPSIGASAFGHQLAKRYGHKIIPTSPALVPFAAPGFSELSGISLEAKITCNDKIIKEPVLFTHKGLSGPCILKISLFWNHGDKIIVDWAPGIDLELFISKAKGSQQIIKFLKTYIPTKFAEYLLDKLYMDHKLTIGSMNKKQINALFSQIHTMEIIPTGTEGFRKAEVTKGGIDTSKVSSKTLESLYRPNLHFIGEVLDVTGQLGGHNFQWCWASAHAVGEAIK